MTKEEFEQGYAKRSHVTVEQLHEWGQGAEPCDCGCEECMGWQMVNTDRPHDGFDRDGKDLLDVIDEELDRRYGPDADWQKEWTEQGQRKDKP